MGAKNSTPQTARIENPDNRIPIYVTPSVVSRLESANSNKQQTNSTIINDNEKSPEKKEWTKQHDNNQQQQQEEEEEEEEKQQQQRQQQQKEGEGEGEEATNKQNYVEDNEHDASNSDKLSKNRFKEDWSHIKDLMEQQYNALDERAYNHTCEKIKKLLTDSNMKLREVANKEISETRLKLLQCLRDNPNETLSCAKIAKDYRDAIHREQSRKINEFSNSNNGEETYKSCSN